MRVFDEIKAYVESGKDINKFHSKEAVLFFFLDSYYQRDVYNGDQFGEEYCARFAVEPR